MALVGGRWFTVVELVGTSGRRSIKRFEQSAPADDAAARVASLALITDLAGVSGAAIASYHTYQEFVEDAFALPAAANLSDQAVLTFDIDGYPTKRGTVVIPAPLDAIFEDEDGPGYDVVDKANVALGAFADNFLLDELFYVSDGEQAANLLGGKRRSARWSTS